MTCARVPPALLASLSKHSTHRLGGNERLNRMLRLLWYYTVLLGAYKPVSTHTHTQTDTV